MIQNNRLWVLMSRLLSGEADPSEAEELQQLLEQSPEKQYLLDILHSYFTVLPANIAGPDLADTDLEARFRKIVDPEKANAEDPSPAQEDTVRIVRWPFRKIAGYAAAAAAILLGWGLYTIRP